VKFLHESIASKFVIHFTIAFFLVINTLSSYSQKTGCTDPKANNYNAAASKNNGTCTYNTTTYAPPIKVRSISKLLNESSGLQMVGNYLWSCNDGGGAAAIYRIDTATDALLQTVNLEDATNVDWEEISFDGTYFYVGDFGNNVNGARTDLKIYKFALNDVAEYVTNPVVTIPKEKIEVISFRYSNQLLPEVSATNNTKYDCEAMIIDRGKIHLFSKNWINVNTTHYVINSTAAGSYIADSVETLATDFLVTGAGKARGQQIIVFIGYFPKAPGKHFMQILSDYSGGSYFNGNKRKLNLPDALSMGQAEGITFRNGSYGYISNERLAAGPFTINQKLRSFDIRNYVTISSKRSRTSASK
jgi:hypothetical protein